MSAERMNVTEQTNIKLCPYWRRITIIGNKVIALCGKTSIQEPRLPDTDLGPRLRKCQYGFSASDAYQVPSIIVDYKHGHYFEVASIDPGINGINQMEELWDEYVERLRNG